MMCVRERGLSPTHAELSEHVAARLKKKPGRMIANSIEDVGVLFANVVNFKDFYSEDYNEGIVRAEG